MKKLNITSLFIIPCIFISAKGMLHPTFEQISFNDKFKNIMYATLLSRSKNDICDGNDCSKALVNGFTQLDLSKNECIKSSPQSLLLGLYRLHAIHKIHFNKKLENPDPEIMDLIYLEKLNLSFNDLATLGEGFEQLTNLRDLNVSNNKLTELPEAIYQHKTLKMLDISQNPIPEFDIEKMKRKPWLKLLYK